MLAVQASAWRFTYGSPKKTVADGANTGCRGISHPKGAVFTFKRDSIETCCISLWTNGACSGSAAGKSCASWEKAASTALNSYKVTGCTL